MIARHFKTWINTIVHIKQNKIQLDKEEEENFKKKEKKRTPQ